MQVIILLQYSDMRHLLSDPGGTIRVKYIGEGIIDSNNLKYSK